MLLVEGVTTAVTSPILISLMSPKVDAFPTHTFTPAKRNHPATMGAHGFVRCSVGSRDRLLVLGELGNFHSWATFIVGQLSFRLFSCLRCPILPGLRPFATGYHLLQALVEIEVRLLPGTAVAWLDLIAVLLVNGDLEGVVFHGCSGLVGGLWVNGRFYRYRANSRVYFTSLGSGVVWLEDTAV
jgi:hypothetical protein